jgi:hypothetical protein
MAPINFPTLEDSNPLELFTLLFISVNKLLLEETKYKYYFYSDTCNKHEALFQQKVTPMPSMDMT